MAFSDELIENISQFFFHLHVHSEFSNKRLLDSINRIPNMIEYVAELGQNGLALTDHESLSGHVKFIKEVKSLREQGKISEDFKPILGNEIYLVDENEMLEQKEQGSIKFYHFLLLAKDEEGHRQLKRLSSRAWGRMFNYKGMDRVPTFYKDIEEVIGDNKGHIIASSACLGSKLSQEILKILFEENVDVDETKQRIHDFIIWCQNIFGDNFYIELQPSQTIEQVEVNKYALMIAKAYGIRHIFTTDAHYLKPEDRDIHKAYLTSDEEEQGGGGREVDAFYETTHFFTVKMLADYFNYLEEEDFINGVMNTKFIADGIEIYDLFHKQTIPKVPVPNDSKWYYNNKIYKIASNYKWINKAINSQEIYDRYLVNQSLIGMENKISANEYAEALERLDIEFMEILKASISKEEPMSSYFITEKKNIDIIWEEAESIVAPGRGSAVGYLIDYLIGITQVNPLKQGILMPHWRFISAERPDYPDIDIDIPSHKRNMAFSCLEKYYKTIGGTIIRVCTFGTETSKSAILTACRGLKINNDIGLYLSSLIPVERGKVRSIEDCYYGNESKGLEPVYEFKNIVDEHDNLLQVALGIQGLINKRSSHACGVIVTDKDLMLSNAVMRTPSGELVTQFDLNDSEYVGGIKYDLLCTKTAAMIQATLEMLIKYKNIEWQGSLRSTYDKYIHPDVIDRKTKEMWDILNEGKLISAFQYDSPVGEQALNLIEPTNLLEATAGNNLMRLMVDTGEQPLEKYVRYKRDINEWYKDMEDFGLNQEEIKIMEGHLLNDYGVCSTQEGMMLMSMDERVANFNVVESNKLRKGVAKKIGQMYEMAHRLFYEKGLANGARKTLLDYIWDVQIAMQKGYGFSLLHSIAYTYILIQQLNLVYYYNPIFWNTAVLLVESGALEIEELEDDEATEDEEDDTTKRKEKATNYGTIAKAIGILQNHGVKLALPDINKAELGFIPDIENDQIIFGLKGVMKLNNESAKLIMQIRPFSTFEEVYERMVLTKREVTLRTGKKQQKSLLNNSQIIMLIKAGAFDNIVKDKTREELLRHYLRLVNPPKRSINGKQIEQVIQLGIVPNEYKDDIRIYRFRNYILSFSWIQDESTKTIKWYTIYEDYAIDFFNINFINDMQENRDYKYDENGNIMVAMGTTRKGSFESIYKEKLTNFNKWLNTKECVDLYNQILFKEIEDKEMQGNISTWEMESINFYYHEHELKNVDVDKYDVHNFYDLSEEPTVIGHTKYNGKQYPKFKLYRIVGTVLDRDKNKHIVSILTPTGVVQIKFHQGQFAFYDKTLSIIDEDTGKKSVVEGSWFARGTKLLVTGFRRGEQFLPKRYKNSIYQHSVSKITSIDKDGLLDLQSERVNISNE